MSKPIGILLLLTILAGCTSTGDVPAYAQPGGCDGHPWSWCAGYHGR
jgi:hypothetical protein